MPGVDLILPDIRFLIEQRRNIVGLVLTHAHEDHMGALIDLWPRLNVPLYASPFAAALFEARRLSEPGAPKIPVNVVPVGGHLTLGPFAIDFINVAHSIPESNALAIRTPLGTVLHTGDWKIDPTPLIGAPTDQAKLDRARRRRRAGAGRRFHQRGPRRPLAVGSGRGENADRTDPHRAGARRGDDLRLARRAHPRGRRCRARRRPRGGVWSAAPWSAWSQVARETGYLDGVQDFRGAESYGYLPPDKVVALCTGSQGEPRAALSRIAEDEHPEVTLTRGDRVIFSARAIPGNEKAVGAVINGLVGQGIEVITDRTHLVHVSGHPRRDELRDMIGWVRPQILIPAHGEALHLAEHAELARGAGVPQVLVCRNGDLVRLAPGPAGNHR